MARAAAQYVFAALLALLSAQTAAPSHRVTSPEQIVWCAETEQQVAEQLRPDRPERCAAVASIEYTSHVGVPPDAAVLFQRPPPASSLIA